MPTYAVKPTTPTNQYGRVGFYLYVGKLRRYVGQLWPRGERAQ